MNNRPPEPNAAALAIGASAEELLPLVYTELRKLAAVRLARESPGLTLQATALVHEVWLRLGGDRQPRWANRAHFFAAAAEAMRRILIDRARKRGAQRHGGGQVRLDIDNLEVASSAGNDELLLRIDEALERLTRRDPEKAELVKLRYFAGLSFAEVARTLNISEITAKRWWAYARAWLHEEIKNR